MDNCVYVTKKILKLLDVKHTNKYLKDNILAHPDHPSLLSVSDTLKKYSIDNLAIRADTDKLDKLPLPCIVPLGKDGNTEFSIIKSVSENNISYYNQSGKLILKSRDYFNQIWTGVCLLVEKKENSIEPNYKMNTRPERSRHRLLAFTGISLLILLIFQFGNSEVATSPNDLSFSLVYIALKILGLAVGFILLWFEVDQFNPTLQAFCSGGKKVNCNSVLNSKHAYIFKGQISLGLLAFSYFFGTLFFLFASGPSYMSLKIVSFLSFLSLPVILISGYYQGVVIRQWCKFCLIIQAILLGEILTLFTGNFYTTTITFESITLLIFLFILPILGWKLFKPLLEKEKEVNLYKRGLQKLKNNPDIFQGLLSKTRKINSSTEGLGILISNPSSKYSIIKVCNPYCSPCAKAHPILD